MTYAEHVSEIRALKSRPKHVDDTSPIWRTARLFWYATAYNPPKYIDTGADFTVRPGQSLREIGNHEGGIAVPLLD